MHWHTTIQEVSNNIIYYVNALQQFGRYINTTMDELAGSHIFPMGGPPSMDVLLRTDGFNAISPTERKSGGFEQNPFSSVSDNLDRLAVISLVYFGHPITLLCYADKCIVNITKLLQLNRLRCGTGGVGDTMIGENRASCY